MNPILLYALGGASVLAFTSVVLVVAPYAQLGSTPAESKLVPYNTEEAKGRDVYVSLGCVYCHSQQPRDPSFGPDGVRGWGRPSTPGDYAYDYPHQLGTMRTGPDLFNIGARQPSRDWHLAHLYQPRAVVPGSIMPSYPFLFERKSSAGPGEIAVAVPGENKGGVIFAKPEALQLVAYLRALDHTYVSDTIPRTTSGGAR